MSTKLALEVKPRTLCSDMFRFSVSRGKKNKTQSPRSSFVIKCKPVFSGRQTSPFVGLVSRIGVCITLTRQHSLSHKFSSEFPETKESLCVFSHLSSESLSQGRISPWIFGGSWKGSPNLFSAFAFRASVRPSLFPALIGTVRPLSPSQDIASPVTCTYIHPDGLK